jgi:hypothetical protein
VAVAGARSQLIQTLSRTLVLLVWALVLWGSLLITSTLANALGEGTAAAFARLVPARGASVWDWLSPLAMLLALVAGLGVAVVALWNRRRAPETDN